MARVWLLVGFLWIALVIFSFVDVLLTQKWRIRGVPRAVWAVIVVLLSPIGPILWFTLGKEPLPKGTVSGAPDDDPTFLANLRRDEDQDERIRRLEQELADLDDDQPDK
jgi:hypothetical protein